MLEWFEGCWYTASKANVCSSGSLTWIKLGFASISVVPPFCDCDCWFVSSSSSNSKKGRIRTATNMLPSRFPFSRVHWKRGMIVNLSKNEWMHFTDSFLVTLRYPSGSHKQPALNIKLQCKETDVLCAVSYLI